MGVHALRRRGWRWLLGLAAAGAAAYALLARPAAPRLSAAPPATRRPAPAVPVQVAAARRGDLPVYLTGLGSVSAFNTVTVRSRVDGQLISVAFHEGQLVHAGELLAQIDPRPFTVQLTQAEGQLARDAAQLANARINLRRYRNLLANGLIARQQVDDQAATVGQYAGAVQMDRGVIDSAKLQLTYSRVTAPIDGRAGLRLVDVGNVVHASDQTGLLVITQVQPIAVLFTIPEDDLPAVLGKLRAGEHPAVDAYDRAGQKQLASGTLLTADNQIDPSTGTARLKALFPNRDNALFPNQFVNVRLVVDVKKDAVIVPAAALQRGPQGTFVYAVQADHTVAMRPVRVVATTGAAAAVARGVAPGDLVVVDGVDKLRPGSVVAARRSDGGTAGAAPPS
jgi:membrane fusion protein, multidrug efflux system